jgi:uncharacterized protein (TIGR03435 family)
VHLRSIAIGLMTVGSIVYSQTQTNTEKVEFDAASVKLNKSDGAPNSNFPLGPGAVYTPNGGLFSATGFPLITYIAFAYKLTGNDGQSLPSQLPGWATTDRFDIQARAQGNPSKDQMRLMMRSLLGDRFKLAIHYETREVAALALVLLKPEKTGPQLRPHAGDEPCPTEAPPPSAAASAQTPAPNLTLANGLPALCGGIFGMPSSVPGRQRAAARNVTMGLIASLLPGAGNLGRLVVDRTGLTGTFDFSLEWTPELNGPLPPGVDFEPDPSGPTFLDALKEQLGLKLEATKGRVEVFVVDHVERPSEN